MKKSEVLEALIDILDTEDEVAEDMVLEDLAEWDSLARLSLAAFAKKNCGIVLTTEQMNGFATVKDICDALAV